MTGSFLLALLITGSPLPDGRDAAGWVGQLGAAAFDDRVAACKALESLGIQALPALRAAADAADGRVRVRVRALIESIGRQAELDRFRRPTLIRLDFADQPLRAVIAALNDRHDFGLTLRLGPDVRSKLAFARDQDLNLKKELRNRKVTLEVAEPLPFWEAIDRICQAGSLRYGLTYGSPSHDRPGGFQLMSDRTGRGPVVDSGPFRVQLTGLHSHFEQDFTQDFEVLRQQAPRGTTGDLTVDLAILPEPDLTIHQSGAVVITEATDDQGRSLLPASPPAFDAELARHMTSGSASTSIAVPLVVPAPAGTVIRRLRGRVPVAVVARSLDPIVVPLQAPGAVGKLFSTRELTLVIDEATLTPPGPIAVKLTIRSKRDAWSGGNRPGTGPTRYTQFDRDQITERVELREPTGQRIKFDLNYQTSGGDSQGFFNTYRLLVTPVLDVDPDGVPTTTRFPVPAELRFSGFVQTTTEIPFDFRDIPLP